MVKKYRRKRVIERILLIFIGLIIGVGFGWILDDCFHGKVVSGSLAEWFGGIGTTGTLCFSLWSTLRTKPKVEVGLSLEQNRPSFDKLDPNKLFVTFLAFNKSALPVKLKFYGFRKHKHDAFCIPSDPAYAKYDEIKEIKPNDSFKCKFNVEKLIKQLDIANYKKKVEIRFAESNGNPYGIKFKKTDLKLNKKKFQNFMKKRLCA